MRLFGLEKSDSGDQTAIRYREAAVYFAGHPRIGNVFLVGIRKCTLDPVVSLYM